MRYTVRANGGELRVLWWSCISLLITLLLQRQELLAVAMVDMKYPPQDATVAMQKKYACICKRLWKNVPRKTCVLSWWKPWSYCWCWYSVTSHTGCAAMHHDTDSPLDCFILAQINLILYDGCCRFVLCYDVFVAMVCIHLSSWCGEVCWNNVVCEDLEGSGSKGKGTGETMNTGGCLNLNGAS